MLANYTPNLSRWLRRLAAGAPCDHIKPGYRRSFVGRHHIYFRNKPYGIDIIRILHGAMNIAAHL